MCGTGHAAAHASGDKEMTWWFPKQMYRTPQWMVYNGKSHENV